MGIEIIKHRTRNQLRSLFYNFPVPILEALLEAGANPNKIAGWNVVDKPMLFDILSKDSISKLGVGKFLSSRQKQERLTVIKLLTGHGAKLTWQNILLMDEQAINFCFKNINLDFSQSKLEDFSDIVHVLRDAGGDTRDALKTLNEIKYTYRNSPDGLAYLTKMESILNGHYIKSKSSNVEKNEPAASSEPEHKDTSQSNSNVRAVFFSLLGILWPTFYIFLP